MARVVIAVPATVVKSKMSGSATSHFLRRRLALRLGPRLSLGLALENAAGAAQVGFKRKFVLAVAEAGGFVGSVIVIADLNHSERTLIPTLHTANFRFPNHRAQHQNEDD